MPHCSHFMKNKKTGPTGHAALFFLPRPSTDRERLRSGIIFEILFFQSSAAPVREFLLLVAGLQGAASEPPPSLQWKCSISALSLFSLACLSHCTADKDKLNSFFFLRDALFQLRGSGLESALEQQNTEITASVCI